MIEKVNPQHPDKIADRIAGALVDLAYEKAGGLEKSNPRMAAEVLLGHGICTAICETSEEISKEEFDAIVTRIAGEQQHIIFKSVAQDVYLASNQNNGVRCGDNGIFKGCPISEEQRTLSNIARAIYAKFPTDGKYILDSLYNKLIICQSNAKNSELKELYPDAVINPLGEWTGGIYVDSGATNRKLGSDMADGVTGGGLHGKDLSKTDVSMNIFCHIMAQRTKSEYSACCAIGDEFINGIAYKEIVEQARQYIIQLGGFEKLAEWGLF